MNEVRTRLVIVECAGSAREVGRAHGEACREMIGAALGRWVEVIEAREWREAGEYLRRFLAGSGFLEAADRHTPALIEELRGIAEGAGQPFERMLAYNLMDEEWAFRRAGTFGGPVADAGPMPGCTAVALGTSVVAQTMDIPRVHDGTQVVLRISAADGPARLVFSAAGMLGLNGANAAGVGVVVNNLAQLPTSRHGLPVAMVLWGILGCSTAAEAAGLVERVPHAIGQHYLIGDGLETISLEAAASGVVRLPVGERYVHANHPMTPPTDLGRSADADEIEVASNTHARQERAAELMRDVADVAQVEALLADRQAPISCAPDRGSMTFGATSIAWDGDAAPTVCVAPGPPHETPWQTIAWG